MARGEFRTALSDAQLPDLRPEISRPSKQRTGGAVMPAGPKLEFAADEATYRRSIEAAISRLGAERAEYARRRRLHGLNEEEQLYLDEIEAEIDRFELRLEPEPRADVDEALESLESRLRAMMTAEVLRRAGR